MDGTTDHSGYGHILKYTGLFGGVQGLSIAINLVRNKLVALLLGPAGMGLASLFNASLNLVSQATNLGLSFSAVRHLSELFDGDDEAATRRYVGVVRFWGIITAIVGMAAFAMLAPLFSDWLFPDCDHTLHFVCLSPVVAMMALNGCEMAILKGAHQLRHIAAVQLWTIVATLIVSVPLYWIFGVSGIVPVLVLCAFVAMALTMRCSFRLYPPKIRGEWRGLFFGGVDMVRLGVAFVLAGILGSGAEMLIRSFLNVGGNLDAVGLYNAGYMLTVTYAGMVFSAMETDYFPRLSSVNHDNAAVRQLANRQAEVSLLIMGPMLALLIVLLPLLLPLLYSGKFVPVVPMAQVAVFSMYLKAVCLPVAYITLAKGDSVAYFLLEGIYDVVFVLLVVYGFRQWGLVGTGFALALAHLFDLLMIWAYAHFRYGYAPSAQLVRYMAIQYPLGMATYVTTLISSPWLRWLCGMAVAAVSVAISLYIIAYKKTSLWEKIKQRIRR